MSDAYELLRDRDHEGALIIAGRYLAAPHRYGTLADQGLPFVTRIG